MRITFKCRYQLHISITDDNVLLLLLLFLLLLLLLLLLMLLLLLLMLMLMLMLMLLLLLLLRLARFLNKKRRSQKRSPRKTRAKVKNGPKVMRMAAKCELWR